MGPSPCTGSDVMRAQFVLVACAVVFTLTVHGAASRADSAVASTLPSHYPFWVLQMNLCNSGLASCYDGGASVPEAATVIEDTAPDVVTLNEVCQGDVVQLYNTLSSVYAGSTVVWAFKAATDRRTGAAYKCKNGQDYGIGIVVHIPGRMPERRPTAACTPARTPAPTRSARGCASTRSAMSTRARRTWRAPAAAWRRASARTSCRRRSRRVGAAGGGYEPTVVGGDLEPQVQRLARRPGLRAGWLFPARATATSSTSWRPPTSRSARAARST